MFRATHHKYRESDDKIKISYFTFFNLKHLCGKLFSTIKFISSAVFRFSQNLQKLKSKTAAKALDPWETWRNYVSLSFVLQSDPPVRVKPRTLSAGTERAFDKRSLLKLQNAPHPKVSFFLYLMLTTQLTFPALVEWKTQANVNGLNFICQVTYVTAYNAFQMV